MVVKLIYFDQVDKEIQNVRKIEETGLYRLTITQYGQAVGREYPVDHVSHVMCIPRVL